MRVCRERNGDAPDGGEVDSVLLNCTHEGLIVDGVCGNAVCGTRATTWDELGAELAR